MANGLVTTRGGGGIGNLYFAFTVTKTSISHKHDLNIQALA
jgi:hypothetical protein